MTMEKVSVSPLEGNGLLRMNRVDSNHNCISSWTGSIHFSTLVRTSANRRKFANKIMEAVEKYDLNGVNLDWGNYTHHLKLMA